MSGNQNRSASGCAFTLKYHLVWCPKYRLNVLVGNVAKRLKEILQQKAEQMDVLIAALEIMPDHVHLFLSAKPTQAPARLVNQFKGYSSRLLRKEFLHLRSRMPVLWSRSYYIGSVGHVSEKTIKKYIETQKRYR